MTKIIKNGIEYGGNTDYKVSQTETSNNADYEVLFSGTADNTTRTEGTGKTNRLIYNPSSGRLMNKLTSVDASQSDNGVSGDTWQGIVLGVDGNNRIISTLEDSVRTDGRISTALLVRNYNTSGTQIGNKGITIYIDKSGNATYGVSDPANFRSAIGLDTTNITSKITITKSSGNWSVHSYTAYRTGNVVTLYIKFKGNGNTVISGTNAFRGTVSGVTPILLSSCCDYVSNSIIIGYLSTSGTIYFHVTVADVTLTASDYADFSITFIASD